MMTNKTIEQIASAHLGKAGDGSIVKPYVTPDSIDKTLLVPVPRILNRTAYNIDETNLPFCGFDVWNAYEFSTLTNNGFPVVGHVKIVYESNSQNIVESKSLKLYLNSFNMVSMGETIFDVINNSTKVITADLKEILGDSVSVTIFNPHNNSMSMPVSPMYQRFNPVETAVKLHTINFNAYSESPDLLEGYMTGRNQEYKISSSALRSNCRVTNQPDWGDVFIYMMSKYTISHESVLKYIVSMRKENHFHEEICECIYKRLYDKFNPDELFVACLYTRRGGIDINPVRASDIHLIKHYSPDLVNSNAYTTKLWRQ